MWKGLRPHPCMVDKNSGDILRAGSPSPAQGPPAQASSARKISLHNFWLQKPGGIELVEETSGVPCSISERNHTRTYSDTPSELQCQGRGLKGTSGIQGRTEMSGIKARTGGQLSPRQKGGQRPLSLF